MGKDLHGSGCEIWRPNTRGYGSGSPASALVPSLRNCPGYSWHNIPYHQGPLPRRSRLPALVSNVLVVCFACVGTLERIYDVVLQYIGLSAGVVGALASWFAISWRGGLVHARKHCEGGATARGTQEKSPIHHALFYG